MPEVMLYRFQPDLMPIDTLERLLKGKNRKKLLEKLTKEIANAVSKKTPRYYLIVGPRGIGKTHFIALLYHRINKIEEVLPIKLSEEEFSIYRVSDLFYRIAENINDEKIELQNLESSSDEDLISLVLEELKNREKMVILFIENLNQIIGEQMDKKEVKKLRSILQKENLFSLVTTAPIIFPQVSEHEEAFFNFLQPIYLKELDREEVRELISEIARIEGNEDFLKKMSKYESKIDTVTVLTGGSPRMAILLYDLMCNEGSLLSVERVFLKILDENTPYYQDIFRMLSGHQRKMFDTLISISKPASPTEIAKKARLDVKSVNTQLRRLEKDGYVISKRMNKSTKYEVRERLFRLWRELRRESSGRKNLTILIEFLELWFNTEEHKEKFLECLEYYRNVSDKTSVKEASYWFLSLPKENKKELLPQIVDKVCEIGYTEILDDLGFDDELKDEAVRKEIKNWLEKEDYEKIITRSKELIKLSKNTNKNISLLRYQSHALRKLSRYEEALEALDKAIELKPEDFRTWGNKGLSLMKLERYEEAIEAFNKAIELNPECEESLRGFTNFTLSLWDFRENNYGNAVKYLNSAISAMRKSEYNLNEVLMDFLKDLINLRDIKALETALNTILETNEESFEVFKPISMAIEIVKTKDTKLYYDAQVEIREIIADIVKKLTNSNELLMEK